MTEPNGPKIVEHEIDGIQEYDNPMPGWWKWTFVACCVFAVGYVIAEHGLGLIQTPQQEWAAEDAIARDKAAAEAANAVTEADLTTLLADASHVSAGAAKFATTCAVCHGAGGEGKIGPNLTDGFWLHGDGTLLAIHKTVAEGVPEKGMPTWKKQMSTQELRDVVAFVGSLRGKNVTGGKAPQGQAVPAKAGL
jgi:cytochrome c oxidase cbb3-type subunit 3